MGDIEFECLHCKRTLIVDGRGAGRQVTCPLCEKEITIPFEVRAAANAKPEVGQNIVFTCTKCPQSLTVDTKNAGLAMQCPACKTWLRVPEPNPVFSEIDETKFDEPAPDPAVVAPPPATNDLNWIQRHLLRRGNQGNAVPKNDPIYKESIANAVATDPDILRAILARGRDDVVAHLAAKNPRCPAEVIRQLVMDALASKGKATVALYALRNPACPADVLVTVAKRKILDVFTKEALHHRHMPSDVLVEVARDSDDDLRSFAIACPVCPAAFINEVALGDRHKHATLKAIQSPACTEETLIAVLRSFESDALSFAALKNPNCTPTMIHAILMRDEDDELSVRAAMHGRCSKDTMLMVLSRDKMDRTSIAMTKSHYCPKELKRRWLQDTGQIDKPRSAEDLRAEQKVIEREEALRELRGDEP